MEDEDHTQTQEFFKLRLKYDPYSPTADEDYNHLRDELEKFDIVGMLAREFRKSRIDEALTKQLVKSLRYLDERTQQVALEISNIQPRRAPSNFSNHFDCCTGSYSRVFIEHCRSGVWPYPRFAI